MDGQKSKAKLLGTHSSLLRSSPTVRSSFHSLSSISEGDFTKSHCKHEEEVEKGLDFGSEEKQKRKPPKKFGSSSQTGSTRFNSFTTTAYFSSLAFLSFLLLFFYLRREETPTSENLLLALIFIAVTLSFVSKNKSLINQTLITTKKLWDEKAKRFGYSKHKQVQWFIGESTPEISKACKENRIVREGVEIYRNGDFYEGEFHKGRCNGSGVYSYLANGKYEGDWVDGKYDGYGIESWAKGSKYKGHYREGLRHGYGAYRFYTGDSYAGEWCNGQSHGVGVQTCADGSCFYGEFKFGVKHGLGYYHFRNGDKYTGEYFGDKIHGFGVYRFANGHRYEGSWHEGRKQGYGMYTFRNGAAKCGEWDAGNLKTHLPTLTDSVQRAVQAARRRAETAISLRRVDEEVKRTVTAAHKAATAARVASIRAVQNRVNGNFCNMDV